MEKQTDKEIEEFDVIAFSEANNSKKKRMLEKLPILDLSKFKEVRNSSQA